MLSDFLGGIVLEGTEYSYRMSNSNHVHKGAKKERIIEKSKKRRHRTDTQTKGRKKKVKQVHTYILYIFKTEC